MQQFMQFIVNHWVLVSLFVVVLVLIFIEEFKTQTGGSSRLTPQAAVSLLNREQIALVDLRDKAAFKQGHIINAINIPHDQLDAKMNKLTKYKEQGVILVCSNGQKSATAVVKLRKAGFTNPRPIAGGMTAWLNASLPVVKG